MSNYKEQGQEIKDRIRAILKDIKEIKRLGVSGEEFGLNLIISIETENGESIEGVILATSRHALALSNQLIEQVMP